jgi:opacity protein-like surface antigen
MFKYVLPAVAGAIIASAALPAAAADLIMPEPKYEEPKVFGGWYLRGHLGMSNQRLGSLYNLQFEEADVLEYLHEGEFDSAPIFGLGFGYQFNDWFRADATVEYRGKSSFYALQYYEGDDGAGGTTIGTDEYTARKSEWVVMGNAYADLGTYHGLTPYVGAGVGASRVTIHNFMDVNTPQSGVAYGATDSKWNFAWALHAGVGFEVTERATIDFGYSFIHLGDGRTGDLITYLGGNSIDNPMHFRDITSHDFKIGLRYKF